MRKICSFLRQLSVGTICSFLGHLYVGLMGFVLGISFWASLATEMPELFWETSRVLSIIGLVISIYHCFRIKSIDPFIRFPILLYPVMLIFFIGLTGASFSEYLSLEWSFMFTAIATIGFILTFCILGDD